MPHRLGQLGVLRQRLPGLQGGHIGGYGAAVEGLCGVPTGKFIAVVRQQQD